VVNQIVLSIGTNVGDKGKNIKTAVKMIETEFDTKVKKSPVYDTPALYMEDQNNFYNCCVSFKSGLSAWKIFEKTAHIEDEMGRIRELNSGPRIIDIDILFIGDRIVADDKLTVPHSDIQDRLFVLQPLYDIIPDFIHPTIGITVEEMLLDCPDTSEITRLRSFWKKK
jgi:2-amino-4-hydroxy-6-hydroxymethyldihydropteridine diphosphokinase